MSLRSEIDDQRWVAHLEGDIDIVSAAELKALLIEALASEKQVQLDLTGTGNVDVAVLQLLWAATLEAEKTHRSFSVTGPFPQNFESLIQQAGFDELLGLLTPRAQHANQTGSNGARADGR